MRSSMPFPTGERLFSVPFNKKSPIENRAAAVGSPYGQCAYPVAVRNAPWVMAVGRDVPIAPPG